MDSAGSGTLTRMRDAPPHPAGHGRSGDDRHDVALELAVVLLLLAPYALSFVAPRGGAQGGFGLEAVATVLRDAGLGALVAFLVWRSSGCLRELGWRWRHPLREIAIGVAAFPVGFVAVRWLDGALQALGVPGPAGPVTFLRPPATAPALAGAVVLAGVVAFVEESVFRGYLLLRFDEVTGSTTVAVIASSVVFALGHGYEGLAGAISVGVLGAGFALLYRWRGSLLAPITAHFLQDLTVLVVLTTLHR